MQSHARAHHRALVALAAVLLLLLLLLVLAAAPAHAKGGTYTNGTWKSNKPVGRETVMTFTAAAFAGTAAGAALAADPKAKCDGARINCYQTFCANIAAGCPGRKSAGLQLASCPEAQFTECWESNDRSFICFGVPRPSEEFSLDAICIGSAHANATSAPASAARSGASSRGAWPGCGELALAIGAALVLLLLA